jgi:hypothetical protein
LNNRLRDISGLLKYGSNRAETIAKTQVLKKCRAKMKTLYFNPGDVVFKAGRPIEILTFKVFCFSNQGDKQVIGVFDQ